MTGVLASLLNLAVFTGVVVAIAGVAFSVVVVGLVVAVTVAASLPRLARRHADLQRRGLDDVSVAR